MTWTGLDQAEKHQAFESFTKRAAANAQHCGKFGFGRKAAADAKFATANQSLNATENRLHDGLAPYGFAGQRMGGRHWGSNFGTPEVCPTNSVLVKNKSFTLMKVGSPIFPA